MLELNKTYCIDNREGMKLLPDNYIDLTVTSPPYDNLRSYNGYCFDFDTVSRELYRVTKEGGIVVWVVGDKVEKGSKSLSCYKQAIHFKEIGFNMFDVIIYQKTSPSPPHRGRYFNSFEYMFILSKGKPKTTNLLSDRPNKCAGTSSGIITRREVDGTLTTKKSLKISDYGIRTNVWTYDVGNNKSSKDKIAFKHPAIFPEKLAEDWSNEGDIVMDIFAGSGTVRKMCKLTNRKYIGFEITEEYVNIDNERNGVS